MINTYIYCTCGAARVPFYPMLIQIAYTVGYKLSFGHMTLRRCQFASMLTFVSGRLGTSLHITHITALNQSLRWFWYYSGYSDNWTQIISVIKATRRVIWSEESSVTMTYVTCSLTPTLYIGEHKMKCKYQLILQRNRKKEYLDIIINVTQCTVIKMVFVVDINVILGADK